MRDLKQMEVGKLLAYSEVITSSVSSLDNLGKIASESFYAGVTSEVRVKEIHNLLSSKIKVLEDCRILLAKEMNRRIKHDLKLSYGPSDIDSFINKILKDNDTITMSKVEHDDYLAKKKAYELSKGKDNKVIKIDKKQ